MCNVQGLKMTVKRDPLYIVFFRYHVQNTLTPERKRGSRPSLLDPPPLSIPPAGGRPVVCEYCSLA